MNPFNYEIAPDADRAVALASGSMASKYLGGGTNLVDLMRENIERPQTLVDVSGLSQEIAWSADGSLMIGGAAKNTAVASEQRIRRELPLLSRAILAGASAQIRNMATVGGNVLQRTRCTYFYDQASRCNKREPGSGCDAIDGFNRYHAILGASPSCVATHPSDMCVALAALDAVVHLSGHQGTRSVKFVDFHRLPEGTPERDTVIDENELITAIEIPVIAFGSRSTYRKVRDRASYAFALISVAAAIDSGEDGVVKDVRLALGGVAHKPWRAFKAEAFLRGKPASEVNLMEAANAELEDVTGLSHNGFKVELARRAIVAVLSDLTGERP
jgi:xanthine dehydrogenase YagS FAD-binding subunit